LFRTYSINFIGSFHSLEVGQAALPVKKYSKLAYQAKHDAEVTTTAVNYLDFDLLIERAGDKYKARVLNSPAGQAATEFSLPFSEEGLENFVLKIGRPRRVSRRVDSPEMEVVKTFGGKLFEAVFNDDVQACFSGSIAEAARQEAGLRLRLRLADAPELADVPWEYLYYNSNLNRFLSLSVETPLVRYLDLPERIRSRRKRCKAKCCSTRLRRRMIWPSGRMDVRKFCRCD
jgi:hypothetical protein